MFTPKTWGWEDEIVNLAYCSKRLFVKEQHRGSIHMHESKDETFLVAEGLIRLETGGDPESLSSMWLKTNDRVRIPPKTWHRFTGMSDTMLFEASSPHVDKDVVRHCSGGKVSDDEFRALEAEYFRHEAGSRILEIDQARVIADNLHADRKCVGMCNGCFDLMHLGHTELLREAKFRCEVLFVAVNSDEAVKKLKGPDRPFVNEIGRAGIVASNRFVDYVVVVDATSCLDVVDAIRPNVYVNTTENGASGPEAREVAKQGGRVEILPLLPGYKTTLIAQAVKSARQVNPTRPVLQSADDIIAKEEAYKARKRRDGKDADVQMV